MRIAYVSDLHIETRSSSTRIPWCRFYPMDLGPSLKDVRTMSPHVLILAGDVGRGRNDTENTGSALYGEQAAQYLGCPVVIIPGNHEYYHNEFVSTRENMLSESGKGVTFLDRGETFVEAAGSCLRILGATMWTDYSYSGNRPVAMANAAARMNDHRIIRFNNRIFSPDDALSEHRESRMWLNSALTVSHTGPSVVVTHHVPHPSLRNPDYPVDHMTAAFLSDMSDTIIAAADAGVSAWIYGHHHHCGNTVIRGMKMLSVQAGYKGEKTGFSGVQIFETD